MAERHDNGDESENGSRSPLPRGKDSLLGRRTFLTVAGAGALGGLAGAAGRSRAAEVDLGAEGLSPGDDIDPYLEEHFVSGNDVYIPPGEYDTRLTWWSTSVSNASIRGDPAGVELRRPEGFWTDRRLRFDGHVVIENITMRGKLGHGRHRLRVRGQSSNARIEFRNFNDPDGSVGSSDAIFMRAEGRGRVDYKWCYLNEYPNSAFYQLSAEPRLVFEGCTFRNSTNIHRRGSDGYTIRDCLYISDGDAPEFCENDTEEERQACEDESDWGGLQRFFKFDGDWTINNLQFENLHYWCEDVPNNGYFMDFQGQPVNGTMDGLFVRNESSQSMFRMENVDLDVTNVHMTGSGNTSTPSFFQTVSDPEEPVRDAPVWTPGGEGHPLVDSNVDDSTSTPDEEEEEGSIFEIVSTSDDAEIEYEFHVDGTAEPTETEDGISSIDEDNVTITDNGDGTTTVTGKTGNGYGDAFEINSHVTTFDRTAGESDYVLRLDGEDVTDEFVDEQESEESVFEIVSTSDGAHLKYEFHVDGTAEPTETEDGISSIDEGNVKITDNGDGTTTVTGKTGNGYGDAFVVAGEITSFERTSGKSSFFLLLDGEDVTDELTDDGPQRVLVDGTVAPEEVNEYRIEVTGEIQVDEENTYVVDGGLAWDSLTDEVDGSTAVGVVGNGVDAYTFTGDIVEASAGGNAVVEVQD